MIRARSIGNFNWLLSIMSIAAKYIDTGLSIADVECLS